MANSIDCNVNEKIDKQNNENIDHKIKLKNTAKGSISNNIFKLVLESLMDELPSKETLQQLLSSNSDGSGSITNAHAKIIKESSIYISCFEDQLSTILACKRFESGHAVSNLSSFTLSYARAFYVNSLTTLQAEIKSSDHKIEWKEISEDFTDEAAKKYVDYLNSKMNFLRNERNEVDLVSLMKLLQDDTQGDDDGNNVISLECGMELSECQSDNLPTAHSFTPNVKEIVLANAFDCTPKFDHGTPKVGKISRKRKNLKSPSFTPVAMEQKYDGPPIVVEKRKEPSNQLSKKRLNFSGTWTTSNADAERCQPSYKSRLKPCPKRNTLRGSVKRVTQPRKMKEFTKNEDVTGKGNSGNFGGRKVFVSTVISDDIARDKSVTFKEKVNLKCDNDSKLRGPPLGFVNTPLKSKEYTFSSPQSPPRKRLTFSLSPKEPDLQNRNQQNWKVTLDEVFEEISEAKRKDFGNTKILSLASPDLSCTNSCSVEFANRSSSSTRPTEIMKKERLLCNESTITTSSGSRQIPKKESVSDNESKRQYKEKSRVSEVMSPVPCMPVASLWAPRKTKAKRTPLRYRLPLCRRSLIRQFTNLSLTRQFMDTPPGSPGSFEPLPLLEF